MGPRAGPCFIVPPHMLEHMAEQAEPEVSAAALGTIMATNALRIQRTLLATVMRGPWPAGRLRRSVHEAGQDWDLPGPLLRGESDAAIGDPAADEAYEAAGDTYAFFDEVMGRKSVDDLGLRVVSTVHFGEGPWEPFDNAFWNGEQMVYGDGDQVVFTRFTRSLEVVAHELTHAVTQYEARLEYHNQSGALNESMADVFGSMVRQWKAGETVSRASWLIGEELLLVPGALRSLKAPGTAYDDPRIGKDPQPDIMSRYVHLADTRRGDWGGVHVNSGIPNRAFYLACVNLGAAYSWEKAGKVWYGALTDRLNATSTFVDAAVATKSIAEEMFGSAAASAVEAAWQEVEVLPRPAAFSVILHAAAAPSAAPPPPRA
jgi:Zn-dependent metalloprotease